MWNTFIKKISLDPVLIGIIGGIGVLLLPFLSSIPYLDGNGEFVQSYELYTGGFPALFAHWNSIHPPLKLWIVWGMFFISGINQYSYNIVGIVLAVLGTIGIYLLGKQLAGITFGRIAASLFAFCPIILATALFSLRDTMIAVFLLYALYWYLKKNTLAYALCASCMCLTKEPGVLLPLSVLFVEFLFDLSAIYHKKSITLNRYFVLLLPVFVYAAWVFVLRWMGYSTWQDWIFAPTAREGAMYTIVWNVFTFHLFNPYAYQQWLQLGVLNFNWIYWILFALGGVLSFNTHAVAYLRKKSLVLQKTLCTLVVFSVLYTLLVLSFQTYPIPRYAVPVYPFLILGVSWFFIQIRNLSRTIFIVSILIITALVGFQLFASVDPISKHFFETTEVLGQKIYNTPGTLDGNDGMTYNMQFLEIAYGRTQDILNHTYKTTSPWIFADVGNDTITLKALHISP